MSATVHQLHCDATRHADAMGFRGARVRARRFTPRCVATSVTALGLLASLTTGCSSSDEQAVSLPTAVLSAQEIQQLQADATEVADSYWGSWPDSDVHERLADDVVFWDPSDGDFAIEGKPAVAPMLRNWVAYFAGTEPSVEGIMLSAEAAAYRFATPSGLWPPWSEEPPDHPPVVLLDVFGFRDTTITRYEVWLEDDSLEMLEFGCFAADGCPQTYEIIDRYLSAWTSRDGDQIAALYADDAVFTDSLLGIDAFGPDAIGDLADERFGSDEDNTLEVVVVYAQTDGHYPPTETSPEQGDVIGIGIHYSVVAHDTSEIVVESLTTFELGERHPEGFNAHPDGLITREEVFHEPATLANLTQ